MLRRLDGMGKYGGYHTEFRHLARGFAGHERALALEVGEALIRAGYLAEKPSVGQRHVSLVAARTSDIRALVERGTCEEPLREPAGLKGPATAENETGRRACSPAASSVDGPGRDRQSNF